MPAPATDPSIAIIAITAHAVTLALQLQGKLPDSVCYVPRRHQFALAMGAEGYDRLGSLLPVIWSRYRTLVCIMATGIVVRQIAPLVRHKTSDPAVIVLDERGHFVISLLSGHLGGANRLAQEIARHTGGQAVITTASDVQQRPALDLLAQEAGLEIENMAMLSRISRAILEGEPFWLYDPDNRLPAVVVNEPLCTRVLLGKGEAGVGIWVSERHAPDDSECLWLRPRILVAGIGCNRGTPSGEILDFLSDVFQKEGLSLLSIHNLASIDLKADESGLLEAAAVLRRPIRFYSRTLIEGIRVPNPSAMVSNHIGVPSVCEATALLSAQTDHLIIPKQKAKNVTVAVARVASPL